MVAAGIEAMNVFGGSVFVDVMELAQHRPLDPARVENLLMRQKAVALPFEDAITYGVNAAKPLLDTLSDAEKDRIEMLLTCSESGIDFGKSMSTYMHHYLGLNRNCPLRAQAGLLRGHRRVSDGGQLRSLLDLAWAKALVIATDISRFSAVDGGTALTTDWSYGEPSSGAGAVAMLVGEEPTVFRVDVGANGYYGYEVMDTCRPTPDGEAGDAELSLLSYLHCCEQAFLEYQRRVEGADFRDTFDYLVFHTPFGGMTKGAHRTMMRKMANATRPEIEVDFHQQVLPGLTYCQRVGNIMGAILFLALASTIDQVHFDAPQRIGCFSYGSGCCSEFYSGMVTPDGHESLRHSAIEKRLDERYQLSMDEYDAVLRASGCVKFGTRNVKLDLDFIPGVLTSFRGKQRLVLQEISEYHRKYVWLS